MKLKKQLINIEIIAPKKKVAVYINNSQLYWDMTAKDCRKQLQKNDSNLLNHDVTEIHSFNGLIVVTICDLAEDSNYKILNSAINDMNNECKKCKQYKLNKCSGCHMKLAYFKVEDVLKTF